MAGRREEKLVKMGEGKRECTYCRTLCEEAAVEGVADSVCLFSLAYDSSHFPSSSSSSLEMVQARDCKYLTEDSANQDNMDVDATLGNSIHICCVNRLTAFISVVSTADCNIPTHKNKFHHVCTGCNTVSKLHFHLSECTMIMSRGSISNSTKQNSHVHSQQNSI